jgi:hypothetical protein
MNDAVGKIIKFIPNIFEVGQVTNGNIITIINTNHLKKEGILKLYDDNDDEIITNVLYIINETQFVISTNLDCNEVFVYGQEIQDFKVVDKDIIFTMTTAAVKEIDRELQELKQEMKDMKQTITELVNTTIFQQNQIEWLMHQAT